jgi:hypothetical protein
MAPPFLNSALDGSEWSASPPSRFTPPRERAPGAHWTGGWVEPKAGMDIVKKRKSLAPARNQTLIPLLSSQ